jgi:hypothetical protein
LTNALIIDRPITVLPYGTVPEAKPEANQTIVSEKSEIPQSNITQRDFHGVPDEQRVRW